MISEIFKTKRNELKLKHSAVSSRVGISESHYRAIENGTVHPSYRTAFEIAQAMKINLAEISSYLINHETDFINKMMGNYEKDATKKD